jgi:lipopolysaccharide transport system permease protein
MFLNPLALLWRERRLIGSLTSHGLRSRFRGSWLGWLWPVLLPVLLLLVFTFVFGFVMPLRWVGENPAERGFPLVLYAGLVLFMFFGDVVGRAPALILENTNLVKKVVFPLEILPVVSVLTALVFLLINLAVFLLFLALTGSPPTLAWLWLPLIVAPLALGLLGVAWFLSALTVYVRDVTHMISVIVSAMMFLSPVFYPLSVPPEAIQPVLALNPLAQAIESLRAVVFTGSVPEARMLGPLWLSGLAVFWLGFAWFRRTKDGFADVL